MTLIDKAEALAILAAAPNAKNGLWAKRKKALYEQVDALPARGVKPLVWDRCGNAQGYGCKYMVYEAGTGWNAVLYPSDAAHYQILTGGPEAEAVAACDNDHRARILAALSATTEEGHE